MILESGESEAHAGDHTAEHADHDHAEGAHADAGHDAKEGLVETGQDEVLERLATEQTNSGVISELAARERQAAVSGAAIVSSQEEIKPAISSVEENVLTKRQAGVFFGIYYCMTGVHAIHIIGGIAVLVWLLFRAVRQDFNRRYFGPVDYVGLYWHLVDLIWIYLFPLLYLIR